MSTSDEIEQIINSVNCHPEKILGMHRNQNDLIIRCFFPRAKQIFLLKTIKASTKNNSRYKKIPMTKINDTGFFETEIKDSKPFDYKFHVIDGSGNSKKVFDPYSFKPLLTDFDLYLFGQGTHYEIFNKLGAHKTKIKNIEGVHFVVWAPNAKRVSVIGDFNNWDGRQNPMCLRANSGVWELFIPELKNFDLYKFEIKTQDDYILKKSDPYANFAQLRPDTASVVFDIQSDFRVI